MSEKSEKRNRVLGAKVVFFFKETFRAHSRAEYKEIFSRGLNRDNSGVSGAFPWLYVRAFFVLFILFTINTLILRLTDNALYIPSVTFLGGITFTIPFIILLYELYPKRDISLFMVMAVVVIGGTIASVLSQIGYAVIPVKNKWMSAIVAGCLEEFCKAVPALIIISVLRKKNPYACYLLAAAVGAGFSVIEDMGYIFYYSDRYYFEYHSDIQALVSMFADRGMSSFCSHILWTGAIGWAYYYFAHPFRWLRFIGLCALSVGLHICWDLPFQGLWQALIIFACVIIAASVNISIAHISRIKTLASEVDLTAVNEGIIRKAKSMGERMRFTNAANLTLSLMCTILSVLVLLFCALPIGIEYTRREFADVAAFETYLDGGYELYADWERKCDLTAEDNAEERYVDGELVYVVQSDSARGGAVYYYGYYMTELDRPDSISVELEIDGLTTRYYCNEYKFGNDVRYIFDIYGNTLIDYTYNSDGSVTAVLDASEFANYKSLIILCSTGVAVVSACTIILIAFTIKLRRLKDAE